MTITETLEKKADVILDRIICGDAYATLMGLPDGFVDTTVTSPPYWLQRNYLPDGHRLGSFEMGREGSVRQYVDDLADLFGQVYRITKHGGSCWVNLGDKVAGPGTRKLAPEYRDGETMGIPARFSEAMRSRGWRRVAEVVWSKPNPMVGARPSGPVVSHEMVYLFAKGDHYYDRHAVQDPAKEGGSRKNRSPKYEGDQHRNTDHYLVNMTRQCRSVWEVPVVSFNSRKLLGDIREDGTYLERDPECPCHGDGPGVTDLPLFDRGEVAARTCLPVKLDHFAPMSPEIVERCVSLTTSGRGNCRHCGTPYRRVTESERTPTRPGRDVAVDHAGLANRDPMRHVTSFRTVAWEKPCGCPPGYPTPPVVFDPFVGTGAVPMVAQALGRAWLGVELHPGYARRLAPARIAAGYQRKYRP